MFKRIKQIKDAVDKVTTAKNVFKDEFAKNAESQISEGTVSIIRQTLIQVFQQFVNERRQIIADDVKFIEALDLAYDNLPLQLKIPLRKKRFRKIMLNLKNIYLSEKGNLADSVTVKMIAEDMKEYAED